MRSAKQAEIEDKVKQIESKLKKNCNYEDLRTLTQLKYDYNCILSQNVEFSLFRMRQKYYESGDKAGKLLANCIKQKELSSFISAIRSEEGELKAKSLDINNMFREYYVNLYTADSHQMKSQWKHFSKE